MGSPSARKVWEASHWPVPRKTRHVWIDFGRDDCPLQGLVLEWRRHAYKWYALVVFVDEHFDPPVTCQQWIPRDSLTKVGVRGGDMPLKEYHPPYS